MATSTTGTGGRRILGYGALLLVLAAGCSGGGKPAAHGFPTPAPGKVAAFDLGAFSGKYDLDDAVRSGPPGSPVVSDRAGNVYMVARDSGSTDVLRMTPAGSVGRYLRTNADPARMVVRADGSVVFGGSHAKPGALAAFTKGGAERDVPVPSAYTSPQPVGERPDGSLVVSEGPNLWAVKDGKGTRLYHGARAVGDDAVVDGSGTLYTVQGSLADTVAVPAGGQASRVQVTGKDPATGEPLAAFSPVAMAPAHGGGFYALATDPSLAEYVVLYARKGTTTLLSRQRTADKACAPGKQYPALDNTCEVQTDVVESGSRVLLLGNLVSYGTGHPQPALALKAAAQGTP